MQVPPSGIVGVCWARMRRESGRKSEMSINGCILNRVGGLMVQLTKGEFCFEAEECKVLFVVRV